ncbi:ribulose-phosphate 3-epimerase [bacterium]|nr:ribulose-phosphate 3-epimerase [bacterium]
MEKVYVSPSILSADFANLERDIKLVENAGADWIHVDVMDGHFVPNITIGAPVVKSIRKVTNLPLDVHLMIENPEKYIEDFVKAGADIITFHYEAQCCHCEEQRDVAISSLIKRIRSFGLKAGISIKPKTSPEVLLPYLSEIDMALVMTVEPGFGGQKFMEDCAKKVAYIRKNSPKNLIIQVDGGINDITGKICKDYGANSLVAGSYIYGAKDLSQAILSLK